MLIALICLITGFFTGKRCLERVKIIESIVLMIKTIKTQIEFSRLPVLNLFEYLGECKDFSKLTFLSDTVQLMKKGEDFITSWNKAVTVFSESTSLDSDEITLLRSFANGLGNSDLSGQMSNCDTYINLFELKLGTLKAKSESTVKICNSLGFMSAALVIIVFY